MSEPAPPSIPEHPPEGNPGPLTPETIERVLADFRRWLEDRPAGEAAPPARPEPPDLHTLLGQMIAVRQEVNLQTKAVRAQQELNTESLQLLAPIQPRNIALAADGSVAGYGGAGPEGYGESADQIRAYFTVAEYEKFTVGWFYQQIARALWDLEARAQAVGETLFTGDPGRQVAWPTAPGRLFRVTDLTTALWSIYEIIHQGEGSPGDPDETTDKREELAHFYRFQEIVKGRRLIKVDGRWVFEGDPIPFDPDGVYPMVDDPDTDALPPESRVAEESLLCDRLYGDLLTALGDVFDGHPEDLDATVELMFSLEIQAKRLLSMPIGPGASTVAGPSFQVRGA